VRCESIVRISSKAPERFNHASNGQTANITNVDVDCRTRDTETGGIDKKSKDPRGSHFMYTKKRKKRERERDCILAQATVLLKTEEMIRIKIKFYTRHTDT
jgi:cytochrome oxidase assembly protein ShyY1